MDHRNILYNFCKSSLLIVAMLAFRCWYTHSFFYSFLLWNLLLAFIPYCISQYLTYGGKAITGVKWWLCFGAWLLFFPNAPYIITDLIHLPKRNDIPKWFDAALLFCTASTGLWIGCISLMQMELLWRKKVPNIQPAFFTAITFLLCGFGIYLGRVLRFNSWDVLSHPIKLVLAIGHRVILPWQHVHTWFITVLFATILWIGYSQVKNIVQHKIF